MIATLSKMLVALLFWLSLVTFSASAQTNFTILKSFSGIPGPIVPYGSLIADSNLLLYGTTAAGGALTQGVVFAISPDGSSFRILKDIIGLTNGMTPYGALALGKDGRLYGMTYSGGASNLGTVFGLDRDGNNFSVLHSFTGGSDGQNPQVGVTEGSDGALYGVTYFSNTSVRGTIFKINKNGTGYFVMHTFTGNPDGQQTRCKLIEGSDGAIYGTTPFGGNHNAGIIFMINKDGTGYNIIFNFGSITASGTLAAGGVIEGTDHLLYGVTGSGGGSGNLGVIYRVDKIGENYQVIHRFADNGSGGETPIGELCETTNGILYGCTEFGGNDSAGSVYRINEDGSNYTVVRSFKSSSTGDANSPVAALLLLPNGIFYGTTPYGGANDTGCIFALSDSPLAPRLVTLAPPSNLKAALQFTATANIPYDVERSTDLSSWTILGTLAAPLSCQTNFTDNAPPTQGAFYRLHQH
jgi:uncharacterized repeat protein (TIGR03803 family)